MITTAKYKLGLFALISLYAQIALAAINLSFDTINASNSMVSGNSGGVVRYSNVDGGGLMDAELVAFNTYTGKAEKFNDANNSDIKINQRLDSSTSYTLSFYEAGTSTLATAFDFDLVFIDIDGNNGLESVIMECSRVCVGCWGQCKW